MPHWIYVLDVSCEGLVAQLTLNGVDVFNEWEGKPRQAQTKLNPYIFEGSNHLELALTPMTDDEGNALPVARSMTVKLIAGEHGKEPGPQGVLATFRWDEAALPVPPGELTGVWGRQFTVPAERAYGRWIWQDAPTTPPGEGDARALVALAADVHAAMVARDVEAMIALTALKTRELARALDTPIAEIDEGQRELFGELFNDPTWRVAPFDPSQLAAVPCAGGRMVRVTDPSGGPALVAATDERPFAFGFLATRFSDRWTIVR
jgi:hypothetical protein